MAVKVESGTDNFMTLKVRDGKLLFDGVELDTGDIELKGVTSFQLSQDAEDHHLLARLKVELLVELEKDTVSKSK